MEKRALIALALSMAVFVVFMYIGQRSRVGQVPPAPEAQQTTQTPQAQQTQPAHRRWPRLPSVRRSNRRWPRLRPRPAGQDVVVDTPLFRAVFTERAAA